MSENPYYQQPQQGGQPQYQGNPQQYQQGAPQYQQPQQQYQQQPYAPQPQYQQQQQPYNQQYNEQQYGQQQQYSAQDQFNQNSSNQNYGAAPMYQQQQQSYGHEPAYQVTSNPPLGSGKNDMSQPLTNNTERFKESNPCRDVLWAIAFVIQLFAMSGVSIYFYSKNRSVLNGVENNSAFVNKHFFALGFLIFATGVVCAGAWLYIIKRFAYCLIWFSLYLNLGIWVGLGLISLISGQVLMAIICFVIAAFTGLWMWCVRDRIRFASAMISISIRALLVMPTNFLLPPLSVFLQVIWTFIWTVGLVFVVYDGQSSGQNNSGQINNGVLFLLLLSFYWTSQVIANIVLVTVMGSVATWYFRYPDEKPRSPVWGSFKRASTTSFGSICFGSFLVAILQTLKAMVRQVQRSDHSVAVCLATCILNCLEDILEYFNMYAYCQVAIYGKTYCQAAKATWQLLKSKGVDAIINDDLVNSVLMIASLVSAAITGAVAVLAAHYIFKVSVWQPWIAVGILIGFALTLCVTIVVAAAVKTLFVCFAEDPAVLSEKKPNEYKELENAWVARYGKLPARLMNPN